MAYDIEFRLGTLADLPAMEQVGDKLFDHTVKPDRAREFLSDPRHHLMLAYHNDQLVGIASGFHYVHPDKEPALFVNEVGVIEEYQNQEIGRRLVQQLCAYAKTELGCTEAWVATEHSNIAARKAYLAAGGIEEPEPAVLFVWDLKSNEK